MASELPGIFRLQLVAKNIVLDSQGPNTELSL